MHLGGSQSVQFILPPSLCPTLHGFQCLLKSLNHTQVLPLTHLHVFSYKKKQSFFQSSLIVAMPEAIVGETYECMELASSLLLGIECHVFPHNWQDYRGSAGLAAVF